MPGYRTRRARAVGAAVLVAALLGAAVGCTEQSVTATGVPLRDRVAFGAWVRGLPDTRAGLQQLESQLGARLQLASVFVPWSYEFGGPDDRALAEGGQRTLLYAWDTSGTRFAEIAGGVHDAHLQRVADRLRDFPHPVYVRPWAEMNATWSPWQPTADGSKPYGGTPREFVAAWRHVVDFFRSRGVTNIRFVFNVDASDFPENTRVPTIWPGADYVDVLGIDGYNWGQNARTGDTWREAETIFAPMYGLLTSLHPTAPVWIAEVASEEPAADDGAPPDPAHSKAAWIERFLGSTAFPRLTAVAWFNEHKERDWRIDSTPAALAALREQLSADG